MRMREDEEKDESENGKIMSEKNERGTSEKNE